MSAQAALQGLQRFGVQSSQATSGAGPTYNVARHVQVKSWDDSSTAITSATTTLSSPTNEYDAAYDTTPTRTNQTITTLMTVPTGSGNWTGRRVCDHDDTATNVTGSSSTVVAGVDGQVLVKNADFSVALTTNYIFTSVAGGTAPISTLVCNNGLQRIGVQAFQATSGAGPTYGAARHIQTGSIDDSSSAIVAGTTTLASPTNEFDAAFTSATRTNQTISHVLDVPTGSGNFETKRIVSHDDTATNVTGSSSTVCSAIQGTSLTKTSDFSAQYTHNHVFTNIP